MLRRLCIALALVLAVTATAHAQVTVVGSADNAVFAASMVITEPGGAASGDLLFLCMQSTTLGFDAAPTGATWTTLHSGSLANGTNFYIGWALRAGSAVSPTISAGSTSYLSGTMLVVRGQHATPIDVSTASAETTNTAGPDPPSVSASAAGLVIACGFKDYADIDANPIAASTGGYTLYSNSTQFHALETLTITAGTVDPGPFLGNTDSGVRIATTTIIKAAAAAAAVKRMFLLGVG
jgi:hypothetical protein